jgi:hypothetical protein
LKHGCRALEGGNEGRGRGKLVRGRERGWKGGREEGRWEEGREGGGLRDVVLKSVSVHIT